MPGGAAIYDSARLTSEKAHICSWKSNNNHAITHLSSPSLVTSQKLLPHKGKEKINKFNKHDTVEWTMGTMSIRCVARWCVRINPGFVVRIMPSRRKPHKHSSLHFWRTYENDPLKCEQRLILLLQWKCRRRYITGSCGISQRQVFNSFYLNIINFIEHAGQPLQQKFIYDFIKTFALRNLPFA